jgi:hypothetical protein
MCALHWSPSSSMIKSRQIKVHNFVTIFESLLAPLVAGSDNIFTSDAVIYLCKEAQATAPKFSLKAVDLIFETQDQQNR